MFWTVCVFTPSVFVFLVFFTIFVFACFCDDEEEEMPPQLCATGWHTAAGSISWILAATSCLPGALFPVLAFKERLAWT